MAKWRWYARLRREWLLRNSDVHIVSFPKCGRTWLVLMLARVIEAHHQVSIENPLKLRRYKSKVPELPRILQHHDGGPEFRAVDELPRDKSIYAGKKVIFLARDPRDVTISAYFQKTRRNDNYAGTIEEYVYHPVGSIETNIAFYNIWAENRHVPDDFLLMTYEDMHADTEAELRRAVDFIGLSDVSDETIAGAVEACRFENMRKMETTNALGSKRLAPRDVSDETTYKTREGKVGGYTKHLAPPEIEHVDRLIAENLDPLFEQYIRPLEEA